MRRARQSDAVEPIGTDVADVKGRFVSAMDMARMRRSSNEWARAMVNSTRNEKDRAALVLTLYGGFRTSDAARLLGIGERPRRRWFRR